MLLCLFSDHTILNKIIKEQVMRCDSCSCSMYGPESDSEDQAAALELPWGAAIFYPKASVGSG